MHLAFTRWLLLGCSAITLTTNALAGPPAVAPVPADAHPLRFVPNQRQWQQPVLFAADIPAGQLFLEKNRLLVARYDARAVDEMHHHRPAEGHAARIPAHAYAVSFVGANSSPAVRGEQPTGEHTNYFLGNDQSRWATNVPAYTDVRYQQLYPGTDLRFYSRGPVMEYDFELAAGADASRIRLRYEGQQSLRVVDGALQIETSVGRVTEQKPFAYQMAGGKRVAVPCQYALDKSNILTFSLPKGYDHSRPLVIDPVLVYSTYAGASARLNWGYTACPDTLGNLYAASINFTAGYPTTLGAYDTTFNNGDTDIVISKYNPNATTGTSSLIYATYLGGTQEDYPHSLVINRNNELVILGSTNSTNFPTSAGAYDRSYNGGTSDLILAKLSVTGSQLLGATYIGGSAADGQMSTAANNNLYNNFGDDYRGDVTTDRQNNIYFTSVTRSSNFPSTGLTSRGGHEAVVAKLNASLTSLQWSTHLGGTGDDAGYSIELDSLANVYVAGGTTSTNLPGVAGGLNASYRGGAADGFVAYLEQVTSAAGVAMRQSSYLGTSSYDQAYFLQLDRQGAVYVLGQTSGNYPVSAGTYRTANGRQFIQKLNARLTTSVFSTAFGNGSTRAVPNISPTAFLVDNCGQILLSGWGAANVAGLPTTPDALQATAPNSTNGSANDNVSNTFGYLYLMQLSANARRLVYGTYFGTGTTHVDGGTSRFDKQGRIYQAICVRSEPNGNRAPAIITTPNAFARNQIGSAQTTSAAFKMDILRLNADFVPAANGQAGATVGCAPLTVNFSRLTPSNSGTTWNFGNGQTSTQANNVSTVYTTPGTYTVRLTAYDSTSCQPSVSTTSTITVRGIANISAGPDQSICPGSSTTLTLTGAPLTANYAVSWSPATGLSATNTFSVTASPAVTTRYIATVTELGTNGCSTRDTIVVSVSNQLNVTIPRPAPICIGDSISLSVPDAGIGATYIWSPATGLSSTTGRRVLARPTASTTYTVVVTTPGGCTGTASALVVVDAVLALPTSAIPTQVVGQIAFQGTLQGNQHPGATYFWQFGDGQTSTEAAPLHTYAAPGNYFVKLTVTSATGCTISADLPVQVLAEAPTLIPNIITPNADGLNDDFFPQLPATAAPATLEIYNRWGRQVFEQANYVRGWGTAPDVAVGLYYYRLSTASGQSWTGWLEVVK